MFNVITNKWKLTFLAVIVTVCYSHAAYSEETILVGGVEVILPPAEVIYSHGNPYPGGVKLVNFDIDGKGPVATVKPGQEMSVVTDYFYAQPNVADDIINQIIVGYDGIGAQACIFYAVRVHGLYYDMHDGSHVTSGTAHFKLTAPQDPGIYEIRFRYAMDFTPEEAIEKWWNVGGPPTEEATIAILIVQ